MANIIFDKALALLLFLIIIIFFFCISCLPSQDLINHMLVVDDNKRFSALQVLNHSWIKVIIISSSLSFLVYISGRSKIHRPIFTGKKYLKDSLDVLQTFGLWLIVAKKFLTLLLQDQICNSPHCQPYNSYNVSSENLILDQLIIPKLIFFFILITYLVDTVLML